jgi:hypothetical protein
METIMEAMGVHRLSAITTGMAIMGIKAAISGRLHPETPLPKTLGSLNTQVR